MPENISPEEKLLKLIKDDQKKEDPKSSKGNEDFVEQNKKDDGKAPAAKLTQKKGRKKHIFSVLNKIFFLCLIAALVYMVLGYLYPYKSGNKIPKEIKDRSKAALNKQKVEVQPLSKYTTALSRRQIFKIYQPPKPKRKEPEAPEVTLQDLLQGYTFVGIIFGEPSQAIVEEKRTRQSYYLTEGQMLGKIKIEKIEQGKVTVSYNDEVMGIRI